MPGDGSASSVDDEIAELEARLEAARARKLVPLTERIETLAGGWLGLAAMDGGDEDIPPPYTEADLLLGIGLLEEAWRQFLKRRPHVNPRASGRRGPKPQERKDKGLIRRAGLGFRMQAHHEGRTVAWPTRQTREEAEADLALWRAGTDDPPGAQARQRGPRGEGSVVPNGRGFRGQLRHEGKRIYTSTVPTQEEAAEALAAVVAAAPPVARPNRREHIACGTCGGDGHNARTCPHPGAGWEDAGEPPVPPAAAPPLPEAPRIASDAAPPPPQRPPMVEAPAPPEADRSSSFSTSNEEEKWEESAVLPALKRAPIPHAERRCSVCGEVGHRANNARHRRQADRRDTQPAEPEPATEPEIEPPATLAIELTADHLDLVNKVARRLAARLPDHVPFADLVSAGTEGLVDAASRYDATTGNKFEAFAAWRIRGAILDDLREKDSLSRDMRRQSNEIVAVERRLTGVLGRAPLHEEVAKEMGIASEDLHARRLNLSGQTVVSIEDAAPDFLDRLAEDPTPSALEEVSRSEVRAHLDRAIGLLSEREQQVLSLYYRDDLNLKEVGAVMGFTESRACMIKTAAERRLRELVDPDVVEADVPVRSRSGAATPVPPRIVDVPQAPSAPEPMPASPPAREVNISASIPQFPKPADGLQVDSTADAPAPTLERVRRHLPVLDAKGRPHGRTIPARRLSREETRAAAADDYPDVDRPKTRGDCESIPRPCPFVSCAHNLYLDVNSESGAIKLNFPHLDVWEMPESCSLDVADRGGATLEDVGQFANITRERVRQIESRALVALHRRAGAFGLELPTDQPVGYEAGA